jgi:hypothetical protein
MVKMFHRQQQQAIQVIDLDSLARFVAALPQNAPNITINIQTLNINNYPQERDPFDFPRSPGVTLLPERFNEPAPVLCPECWRVVKNGVEYQGREYHEECLPRKRLMSNELCHNMLVMP